MEGDQRRQDMMVQATSTKEAAPAKEIEDSFSESKRRLDRVCGIQLLWHRINRLISTIHSPPKRMDVDIDDLEKVLEMILEHPHSFLKELVSMRIENYEKYGHCEGFS